LQQAAQVAEDARAAVEMAASTKVAELKQAAQAAEDARAEAEIAASTKVAELQKAAQAADNSRVAADSEVSTRVAELQQAVQIAEAAKASADAAAAAKVSEFQDKLLAEAQAAQAAATQFAELQGRLLTEEQARLLVDERRQELEAALETSTARQWELEIARGTAEDKLQQVEDSLASASSLQEHMSEQLTASVAEVAELRVEGEALQGRRQELEDALASTTGEHERIVAELSAKAAQEATTMVEQQRSLQGDCESLRREWAQASHIAEQQKAQLRQDLEDHRCVAEANVRSRMEQILKLQEELEAANAAAKGADVAHEREERAREETRTLEEQHAALAGQNRELLSSVQAFQCDVEAMQAQVRSAMESEEMIQAELDRDRDNTARVAGHANHRQKIQYMQKLKEENIFLRSEKKKAQQRLDMMQQCQRHEAGGRFSLRPNARASLTGDSKVDAAAQEKLRLQKKQERDLEHATTAYKHLYALVKRASVHSQGADGDGHLLYWLRSKQLCVTGLDSSAAEADVGNAQTGAESSPVEAPPQDEA